MPTAQIIAIGTELLLGVTVDTNTAYLAKTLNQYGIDLFKTSIIGDNEQRIAQEIRTSLEQADIVITTGGLGPTVDDPTRQAVALAFETDLDFRAELWEQICQRFKGYGREPSENNKRQAYLPQGAAAIENPVGTAPAFYFLQNDKIVISLPGVPSEMKTLLHDKVMPLLQKQFNLTGITFSLILHVAGMGESNVDELVADFEKYNNPTVGLAAHPGLVDIRITAKAASQAQAMEMISPIETEIRQRLGVKIFGTDDATLPDALNELIAFHHLTFDLFFANSLKSVGQDLEQYPFFHERTEIPDALAAIGQPDDSLYNDGKAHDYLILFQESDQNRQLFKMNLHLSGKLYQNTRSFGGHPALYAAWARNQILSFIRESIIEQKGDVCKQ
jgi:nicotinamide-nucleotide amidase